MPREQVVPDQIADDWKIVRRIAKLADKVVDDSKRVTASQKAFRRLVIQSCLAYEYGSAYLTRPHAEIYDSANHSKEYE